MFGDRDIDTITPEEIHEAVDRISREKCWREGSRTAAVMVLSGFFKWAVKDMHLLEHNPCYAVPRVPSSSLNNGRTRVLTRTQIRKMLDSLATCPPVHDMVILAVSTGLRFSKITGLKHENVSRQGRVLKLTVLDKNGHDHDVFPDGLAREVVERRLKTKGVWLIAGPNGGRITQKFLSERLRIAAAWAKVPYSGRDRDGFSFHTFRRCFASYLLNEGVDLKRLMEAGNWLSYEAAKRYLVLDTRSKRKTFRVASRILD